MRIVQLCIHGFRAINEASIDLDKHSILIGASNAGKSTVIEALSLVLGKDRMHYRPLTEHDFYGSDPQPAARIKLVVTLSGFRDNDPNKNRAWFSDSAGVEKWWAGGSVHGQDPGTGAELCVQVAFCARFDPVDLEVETIRYFLDAEDDYDPFDAPNIRRLSRQALQDVGYYFVPAQRTWDRTISFNSELFRRVVRALSELPAGVLVAERNRLRQPPHPLEETESLRHLVASINANLKELLPKSPTLQLRITETDIDSLLKSLVPHFSLRGTPSLPSRRHGTGLVSLQTLLLLLELGKARTAAEQSFILALEEPEIHLPRDAQRRIIYRLLQRTSQLLITTHSPEVASTLEPETVRVLANKGGVATANRLSEPIQETDSNAIRRLFRDYRPQLLEAVMHDAVLLPEGRIDYEWFSLILRSSLASNSSSVDYGAEVPTEIGVIRTHDAAIVETYSHLAPALPWIVPIADGDRAGSLYVRSLSRLSTPPPRIIQWPKGQAIEDIVGWICKAATAKIIESINALDLFTNRNIDNILELVTLLKSENRSEHGLKGNYLVYDDLGACIADIPACRERCHELLGGLYLAASQGDLAHSEHFTKNDELSTAKTDVYSWSF